MNYVIVDHGDILSPVEEGLYELVDGSYVLTEDGDVDAEKTYYMLDEDEEEPESDYEIAEVSVGDDVAGLYEYDEPNDEYFPTTDTVAIDGKVYYEKFSQTNVPYDEDALYYLVSEPVENPQQEGLYEKGESGYVLTEDNVFDSDKSYYLPVEEPEYEREYEVVEVSVGDDVTGLYEYDQTSDEYSITDDIFAVQGKTYYDLVEDDENAEPEFEFEDEDDITEDESEPIAPVESDDFLFAYMEFVENPNAEGFYEIVNGAYVLTQDAIVNPDKDYYEYYSYSDYYEADMTDVDSPADSLTTYYELSGSNYVPTEDVVVVPGKIYYRSHTEDEYPYVPDPMDGEEPAEWDDIPIEG